VELRNRSPIIIPVFLPNLGCRERCVFCNQKTVAPEVPSPAEVRESIRSCLSRFPSDRRRERQIAFYGGSFTAIPKEDQRAYLKEGHSFLSSGWIDSIRVSTRPDALEEEVLSLLKKYGVKTVELGAQSMIDEVLLLSRRGHSSEDTVSAVSRLKHWGFEVGLHVMMGLPGDSFDSFFETLDQVIRLNPDFLRIHPTLVLKEAPIEALWADGKYSPLTLEEAIRWLKRGLLKLEKVPIPVARIGLQLTKDLEHCILAGPCHPALRQLVDSEIYFDMAVSLLGTHQNERESCFICHPGEISSVRGQRNTNIQRLKDHFEVKSILVNGRQDIPKGSLFMQTLSGEVSIQRRDLIKKDTPGRLKPPLPTNRK
jgi:histone acetyltransferase (RNA polymerase elongator complex component)